MAADLRALIAQAASRYGVDGATLLRIAEMESNLNPAARNPRSTAGGLFQFIDGTARQYGLADRFDPTQAADAAARLLRDNAAHLRRVLGRDATGAELYLAHQQGAGGAGKLLVNPNQPAQAAVGARALRLNAGQPGMTAGQFAGMWTERFSRRPAAPAAPQQPQQLPTLFAAPQPAQSPIAAMFDFDTPEPSAVRPVQQAPIGYLDPRRRAALLAPSAQKSAQNQPVDFQQTQVF